MKIFTVKRVLGIAAIYGVVKYAQKNGGVRQMLDRMFGGKPDDANLKSIEVNRETMAAASSRKLDEKAIASPFPEGGSSGDAFEGNGNGNGTRH